MSDDSAHLHDCTKCLVGIGEIKTQLTMLNASIMKIVYCMIGIIGANIGTKYIGTPIYVYVAMYVALVSAFFVLCMLVAKWGCLSTWERTVRVFFCVYVFYVTGLRIYHYQMSTPLTQAEGVISNVILTLLALSFLMVSWRRDAVLDKYHRRRDDIVGGAS